MSKSNYACSQIVLYAALRFGWIQYRNDLKAFTAFDSDNTEALADENEKLIDETEDLPDFSARKETVATLSLEYDSVVKTVVVLGKYFLSYIVKGYAAEMVDIMKQSAGFDYFDKVKKGDSTATMAFFSSLTTFVKDKKDVLIADGKMPADFQARLQAANLAFAHVSKRYDAAMKEMKEKTDEKIIANNDIYARFLKMLLDGRTMNLETPNKAKTYQLSYILSQVETVKNAGISGKVTDESGKIGLPDIKVVESVYGKSAVTDKKGRYEIAPLSIDTYTLTYSGDGFESQTIKAIAVKTGIVTRQNVVMLPTKKE